jgi:hypothetical protein
MGGFKEVKPGKHKRITLHSGPRTEKEGEAFRRALLALLRKYKMRVVGYRTGVKARKAKARKPKARKPKGKGKKRK